MEIGIVSRTALVYPFRELKFQIERQIVDIFQHRVLGELRNLQDKMNPGLVFLSRAVRIHSVGLRVAIQRKRARGAVYLKLLATVAEHVHAVLLRIYGIYQIFFAAPLPDSPYRLETRFSVVYFADMSLIVFGTAVKARKNKSLLETVIRKKIFFSARCFAGFFGNNPWRRHSWEPSSARSNTWRFGPS